ncbi:MULTISPECIES: hypothetical protein [Vitreoscilla]|uniref:VCBS repeat-containing protein n=1 Tax=Vitreoscilla stercoraria TaxID=61 RepID=A0ABY4ECX3_VITST|nr:MULTISPECIES: hypothetical protein [Vitreoscilla]AUZ04111.2 hypothetical protein ADP71_02980 [Vitreoscilla sp. C1]UOO93193.1 hypothetical protein LVJ81_03935 [Vitreoscilla stercoraria]
MLKTIHKIIAISMVLGTAQWAQAQVLGEARGDLDGDGQAEIVVVTDTGRPSNNDLGSIRKLEVFKIQNGKRSLWQQSQQVILPSQAGGMMGDPFQEISIKNGSLFVNHAGGSSWKWDTRDQYRYQNGQFELIGYQSSSGRICDSWTKIDVNFQTGKMIYKQEADGNVDACDDNIAKIKPINETFVNKNVKLNFKNRHAQEVYVIAPKSKEKIYFSSGN